MASLIACQKMISLVNGYHAVLDACLPSKGSPRARRRSALRADAIITNNTKDFPVTALEPYGIERLTVDEFLLQQFGLDDLLVRKTLTELSKLRQWNLAQLVQRISLMAPEFAKRISQ
jgi:hypothetical protein